MFEICKLKDVNALLKLNIIERSLTICGLLKLVKEKTNGSTNILLNSWRVQGSNIFIFIIYISVHRNREIDHIEFEEFVNIIEEIKEAGWSPRVASPNEPISNIDLLHVFAKVDLNGDQKIDTRVMS